ncbi:MAG: hypothetical protein ACR2PM_07620, partial [Hyphomicrobiales bacterium]
MSAAGSGCPHGRSAVIRMMAAVAFAAAMLMPHAVQAEDVAAGTPNATQTANINSALDRLRQDIADATRVNAGAKPRKKRDQNAREIAVYQRVLDNLTNKLANNELHPIDNLAKGKIDGTNNHVRFVFENDKAGIQGSSSPTGAYCPDNAYVLVGTKKNLKAYTDIKAATPAEARNKRTAFVNAGKVRRIRCPRGHMIFDSALLDPLGGVRIDPTTNDGWCKARELLDVLAHEKFHEIVIEDAIAALRKRKDFREGAASERTRRERAVFWNGA